MSKEFSEVHSWFKKCSNNLFKGHNSFIIWDTMERMKWANEVWIDLAKKNVDTMNRFHYFFVTTMESHRDMCFAHLYKLFDTNPQSTSLKNIIKLIRKNISSLKKADFKEFHKGRFALDSLSKRYRGLTEAKLKRCEKKLDSAKKIIEKLSKFRHKRVAHSPLIDEATPITVKNIEKLFKIASAILKELTYSFDFNIYDPFHSKNIIEHETKTVVEFLSRFEPYRLKEIDKEYKRKIREYIKK